MQTIYPVRAMSGRSLPMSRLWGGQLLHLERAVTEHEVLVLRRVEDLWHAGRPDRRRQVVRMGRPVYATTVGTQPSTAGLGA
jgi:hypothetical protein